MASIVLTGGVQSGTHVYKDETIFPVISPAACCLFPLDKQLANNYSGTGSMLFPHYRNLDIQL